EPGRVLGRAPPVRAQHGLVVPVRVRLGLLRGVAPGPGGGVGVEVGGRVGAVRGVRHTRTVGPTCIVLDPVLTLWARRPDGPSPGVAAPRGRARARTIPP